MRRAAPALLKALSNWGWLLGVVALALGAALYVAIPEGYDAVDPDGPQIPVDLIDHADERAGLERGYQFGAEPAAPLPRPTFLPGYQFHQSPNYSGRGSCGLEAIVLHVTGPGSMAGMASWFKNPASQVSAHFGISKQGEVHQYVGLEASAWHAGIMNLPDLTNPLIQNWKTTGINPNRCHIGIELLLGGPAEPLVNYPLMQQSLNELLLWISGVTAIPLDRVHVIGHYQLDAINRSTDPRCCLEIDKVLSGLKAPVASCVGNPCWTGTDWLFTDGWRWRPSDDTWHDPKARLYWRAREWWGGRCSPVSGECDHAGDDYYIEDIGAWYFVP